MLPGSFARNTTHLDNVKIEDTFIVAFCKNNLARFCQVDDTLERKYKIPEKHLQRSSHFSELLASFRKTYFYRNSRFLRIPSVAIFT